jgi:predicted O-methyltransferase YrrM
MSKELRQLNLEKRGQVDEAIEAVLMEYETRGAAEFELQTQIGEDEWIERRDEFLIAVGRETGMLLNILIKSSRARNILELGTSYGYSAIWLTEAARQNGGKVTSVDLSAKKQEYARSMLKKAGLSAYVELRAGDAREVVPKLDGPFDFVLLDLWKDLYIPCFDLVYPKLTKGAFVAADNILLPEAYRPMGKQYRKHVRSKPNIDSVLLPVGSGVELSCFDETL